MLPRRSLLAHIPLSIRITLLFLLITLIFIIFMQAELNKYHKINSVLSKTRMDFGPINIPNLKDGIIISSSNNTTKDFFDGLKEKPILTLITTFNNSQLDREQLHNNTLTNWVSFIPYIQPVLYGDVKCDSKYGMIIQEIGWKCKTPPRMQEGLPIVSALFQDAIASFDSHFYGYANADIIFGSDLITTLLTIKNNYLDKFRRGFLLSGQRKNIIYKRIRNVDPNKLMKLRTKGRLYFPYALDYFVTTAKGYRWSKFPDLVVGRPGWDNYLVFKALQWRIPFIDASKTITALHQTGSDGNDSGFHHGNNTNINLDIIGNFTWQIGQTICASYSTAYDLLGNGPVLYLRPYLTEQCQLRNYNRRIF